MAVLWLLFAFSFVFRAPDNECFGQSNAAFRDEEIENGSMYLKGGAAVFAAGGIIYSCLDIANFAENVECMNAITVVNACLSIILVIGQLYMIIAKSKVRQTSFFRTRRTNSLPCTV